MSGRGLRSCLVGRTAWRAFLVAPVVWIGAALAVTAPAGGAGVPVLVIDGEGWGHGVGMSQDGAYWMGRNGRTAPQILGHFYPGTSLGRATGPVRVRVLDAPGRAVIVGFPAGGELRSPRRGRQAAGFPVRVKAGEQVTVHFTGPQVKAAVAARVQAPDSVLPPASSTTTLLPTPTTRPVGPSSTSTPAPRTSTTTITPTTTTLPKGRIETSRTVWAAPAPGQATAVPVREASYRGELQAFADGDGVHLVNELDVETYLRGMGEVRDPSWPQAALRVQAVAARTYALRAMAASGELCDSERCQVYLGEQAEYGAMDAAVRATAGQVLTFGGELAAAVYSASGGGVSATPEEGFGTPDASYPYLRATPYATRDFDHWEVRISLADLGRRLGYPGQVRSVGLSRTGPSGRPLDVTLGGTAGRQSVPALEVNRAVGARSTKWGLRVEDATTAPVPPPDVSDAPVQLLPTDQLVAAPSAVEQEPDDEEPRSAENADHDGRAQLVTAAAIALAGSVAAAVVVARGRRAGS